MKTPRVHWMIVGMTCAAVVAGSGTVGRPEKPRLDVAKGVIERPVKHLVGAGKAPPAAGRPAAGKSTSHTPPQAKRVEQRFVNPKVAAGKVRWHRDLQAACAAAKRSGKPVLLFQMMGRLDQRFT